MYKNAKKIMIIAGGSGGHVFPGLSVACYLISNGYEVVWLGTKNRIESELVPKYGINIKFIYMEGWRGKKIYKKMMVLLFFMFFALYQSFKIMRYWKPDVVLSMGGYVSAPSSIAAWLYGIPVIIHEQNKVIGLTNRLLSVFAKTILQGFPGVVSNAVTVGNPLRSEILSIPNPSDRWKNRSGSIRVLVIGGSNGADIFNKVMPEVAKRLDNKLIVWHQSGKKDLNIVTKAYQKIHYSNHKVVSFIDDMDQAYAWADIVISRSGALTVSEIACVGLPAIFVPFLYHKDFQQYWNALSLVQVGAAKIIEQKEFTSDYISTVLDSLDRQMLLKMAQSAKILAMPHATQLVAKSVIYHLR